MVWDENFGSGTFTDKASKTFSGIVTTELVFSFRNPAFLRIGVDCPGHCAKPARCVPPSRCGILLVKQSVFSW